MSSPLGDGALSTEEFTRLQEELLALKFQNHELKEEVRRQRDPQGAASKGRVPDGPNSAFALGRTFAKNMKANAGAFSALGKQSAASIQASLGTIKDGSRGPPGDNAEVEILREEVG